MHATADPHPIGRSLPALLFATWALAAGCGGEDTRTLTVRIRHVVDAQPLVFDDVRYPTAAGQTLSIERLEYYASNLVLRRADGRTVALAGGRALAGVHYCNARGPTGTDAEAVLRFDGVPEGRYAGATLTLGLDASANVTGALPATTANTQMAWPTPMGGGYHFLKLEGRFKPAGSAGPAEGYAMHVGRTENAVAARIDAAFEVAGASPVLALRMNVAEWFRGPHTYDFATDPVYSMSSDAAMRKLADNGADVLTLAPAGSTP